MGDVKDIHKKSVC